MADLKGSDCGIARVSRAHGGFAFSNSHPAWENFRWVAHGFSAPGLSDLEILAPGSIMYGALYAERRRRVGANRTQATNFSGIKAIWTWRRFARRNLTRLPNLPTKSQPAT